MSLLLARRLASSRGSASGTNLLRRLFSTDPLTRDYQLWHLSIQEVEAYDGEKTPLKYLAGIEANPDGTFTVTPWDTSIAGDLCEQLSARDELGMSGVVGFQGEEGSEVINLTVLDDADRAMQQQEMVETAAEKSRQELDKTAVNRSARREAKLSVQAIVDQMSWRDLPPSAQQLYSRLGWSEAEWESDDSTVQTEQLAWADLTKEQQDTAAALGYAQDSWDSWDDLSDEVKARWTTLGWSADSWDTGEDVVTEEMAWSELSAEEREAATQLGYSQESWDSWADLPEESKVLWGVLGWNATNWEIGGPSATEELKWGELTQEQRDAATKLGYQQDTW